MLDFDSQVQNEADRISALLFDVEDFADLAFDPATQAIIWQQATQNVCERQIA